MQLRTSARGQKRTLDRALGGTFEHFCDARLEWLRSRERSLLGKRRKLLGLLGKRFELRACMFGRKLYECRRRRDAGQLLKKIEGSVGVRVSEFDKLVVAVLHALNRCRKAVFDEIGCFSLGGARFPVSFFGLNGALFRIFGPGVHIHSALILRAFPVD